MSKVSLLLAIMLVAVLMCFTACGESNDKNDAASSQSSADQSPSDTKQSPSDAIKTPSASDASVGQDGSEGSVKSDAKSVQDPSEGDGNVNEGSDGKASGDGTSSSNSSDEPETPGDGRSRNEDSTSSEPAVVRPTVPSPKSPEVNDNAEVDINDL
ncbi:MAG: hypothetical protein IJH07_07970 [Ruminococcus sp.]|nr:hypothetical protein [Ruminococcus sp.]